MRIGVKLSLVILGLFLSLLTLEVVLATGLFDNDPRWKPKAYEDLNRAINAANYKRASKHPNKFNDLPRSKDKPEEIIRIAVLGDSFIWGDGLRLEERWSTKLEKRLKTFANNIEVLHWGRNGWSTEDQLRFLRTEGKDYELNMLIIGYVSNDPARSGERPKRLSWHEAPVLKPLRYLFPDSTRFLSSLINRMIEQSSPHYGYANWERALYSKENLERYEKTLVELKRVAEKENIQLRFILTPANPNPIYGELFNKITPLLEKHEIQFLNLAPVISEKFSNRSAIELWANRANTHPGDEITSVFADEAFTFIIPAAIGNAR